MPDHDDVFSEELNTLLDSKQHPMAKEFRRFVAQALQMQVETNDGKTKSISFTPEVLLHVADEVDTLLGIIHALAEIVAKQSSQLDAQDTGPKPGEYLS